MNIRRFRLYVTYHASHATHSIYLEQVNLIFFSHPSFHLSILQVDCRNISYCVLLVFLSTMLKIFVLLLLTVRWTSEQEIYRLGINNGAL